MQIPWPHPQHAKGGSKYEFSTSSDVGDIWNKLQEASVLHKQVVTKCVHSRLPPKAGIGLG